MNCFLLLIILSIILTGFSYRDSKKNTPFLFLSNIFTLLSFSFFFSYTFERSKIIWAIYELFSFFIVLLILVHSKTNPAKTHSTPLTWGFLSLAIFCKMTQTWVVDTFPLSDVATVILTIQMPLTGFITPFIFNYAIFVLPVSICCLMSFLLIKKTSSLNSLWLNLLTIVLFLWSFFSFVFEVPVKEYYNSIKNEKENFTPQESSFWNDNFVDINHYPRETPSQKQNLIFIIMESMENSFADTGNGGVNSANYIPEITKLAHENINFSPSPTIGGGIDVNGSLNTISSTIAKLTGIPVLRQAFRDNLILPGFTSIYEILKRDGYTNFFIQGTDASFAGLESFLKKHGVDSLLDSKTLKLEMDVDARWRNFRNFFIGLTDRKLYDISRHLLTDSTLLRRPFTLTIATIETHYPYGFYNSNCEIKPDDSKEENIFKATVQCASFDLGNFISWCQRQPFFENTTIVITGDHLFPGSHLVSRVRPNRSWINIFINSRVKAIKEKDRFFTSFDIAPSLLESLGYKLHQHQMGFGISLFSEKKTLLEQYSFPVFTNELYNLYKARQYLERVMGP